MGRHCTSLSIPDVMLRHMMKLFGETETIFILLV